MDRLHSFNGSYTLGLAMIKGFGGLFSSALDAKLVQEHLLQLYWEYEEKFPSSRKVDRKYNFYKHVLTLLSEWEDHPGLQKVLELIEMLLAIPLSTRFLRMPDVTGKWLKIFTLWYVFLITEMEFDSWPVLLDNKVQDQNDINAAKGAVCQFWITCFGQE
ncbi:midasin-like protein [Corchorus olitorius]|uniref:Midasin-like protein n=1 Tax=Corchorus olitorius TaxID=93759 RepID=A0A1R3H704_9ROSI|nr:midasin-like protein [Corchorus olitorius]